MRYGSAFYCLEYFLVFCSNDAIWKICKWKSVKEKKKNFSRVREFLLPGWKKNVVRNVTEHRKGNGFGFQRIRVKIKYRSESNMIIRWRIPI